MNLVVVVVTLVNNWKSLYLNENGKFNWVPTLGFYRNLSCWVNDFHVFSHVISLLLIRREGMQWCQKGEWEGGRENGKEFQTNLRGFESILNFDIWLGNWAIWFTAHINYFLSYPFKLSHSTFCCELYVGYTVLALLGEFLDLVVSATLFGYYIWLFFQLYHTSEFFVLIITLLFFFPDLKLVEYLDIICNRMFFWHLYTIWSAMERGYFNWNENIAESQVNEQNTLK